MDTGSIRRGSFAAAFSLVLAASAWGGIKHNFDRPVFVYAFHPDVPIARFAAGALGIPEPQHARIYSFAAYRYFEGRPLSAREQRMWLRVWESRAQYSWPGPPTIPPAWTNIRKKVPLPDKSNAAEQPVTIRLRDYTYYELCNSDAYELAARILADRIRRFGASSAEVKFWTEGQDGVLRVCQTSVPENLATAPAGMHPIIGADREYQNAAVLFYSQRFDEAAHAFRRIATDSTSPWRVWAPYMAGRTLLWKARQTQSEPLYRQTLLEAEKQFRAVLADRRLRASHQAAEYLLLRCMLITNPRRALSRIAVQLNRGTWRESDLTLYLNGLDALATEKGIPRGLWPDDPLSQWLLSFAAASSYEPAAARWRQTRSRAWLYAALWRAGASAPDELISAALSSDLTQPGGVALRYAAARLLAQKGRFDEAREQVDRVISALAEFPSAHNCALQLRVQLARDLDEFIRVAPRKVILGSTEMDRSEWRWSDKPDLAWIEAQRPELQPHMRRAHLAHAATAAKLMSLPRFDETSASILNECIPLTILKTIATSPGLPAHLRDELRVVVWTRAVLLNRFDIAREFDRPLATLFQNLEPAIRRFDANPSEETAAFVLLDLPGARPYVSRGYGRNLPPTEHDEWARNWWYRFTEKEMHDIDLPYIGGFLSDLPSSPPLLPTLSFVSPEAAAQAAAEYALLRKTGDRGLNWIAQRIAAVVTREPKRPGAAETLVRVLESAWISNWTERPDYELPQPGLRAVHRLLSTRYRRTAAFRRYEENRPGWDFPRWE